MESNDSPEIPYRGETSDIPGLPSGGEGQRDMYIERETGIDREREREGDHPTYQRSPVNRNRTRDTQRQRGKDTERERQRDRDRDRDR